MLHDNALYGRYGRSSKLFSSIKTKMPRTECSNPSRNNPAISINQQICPLYRRVWIISIKQPLKLYDYGVQNLSSYFVLHSTDVCIVIVKF